jgi:hypothetical protein
MNFGQIAKLNDDELLAALDAPELPWPHVGQEFDVEIVVTGGGEYELEVMLVKNTAPEEVLEAMYPVSGVYITDELFHEDEIPTKPGRYVARLKYWQEDSVDWESGFNDPEYGFVIVHCRMTVLSVLRRAGAKVFDTLIKAPVRWWVRTWPYGYLCDFHWEGQGRIRLTKDLWVIVGGTKDDPSMDALPISFVSQKLVDRIGEEMNGKWYMPDDAGQK